MPRPSLAGPRLQRRSHEFEVAALLASAVHERTDVVGAINELLPRCRADALEGTFAHQRMRALLGTRLLEIAEAVPPGLASDLRREAAAASQAGAAHELVTAGVLRAISAERIPVVPLKGPLLARRLFGDPGMRESTDIDVLVPVEAMGDVADALAPLGWLPARGERDDGRPALHWSLVHRGELPPVEIHWRVHWYEETFARAALTRAALDGSVGLRMAPADELVCLLLFYARDGFVGLRQAADIAAWQAGAAEPLPGLLDAVVEAHPRLELVLATAARAAERVAGTETAAAITRSAPLPARARAALALANPQAVGSPLQRFHDATLVDGLLGPEGTAAEYMRRQLLPRDEVLLRRNPALAAGPRWRVGAARAEHLARVLRRYVLRVARRVVQGQLRVPEPIGRELVDGDRHGLADMGGRLRATPPGTLPADWARRAAHATPTSETDMSTPSAPEFDVLVVGAGFAGSILAERLATMCDQRVLVVDRRSHIGGNAYDYLDEHGVLVHKYGPHIFHTNSQKVVDYLSQFTGWRPYEHRVVARVDGKLVPIPINRTTINELYGLDLRTEEEVQAFYDDRAEPVALLKTSEDAVVAKVGRDLYEKFFRGYTRKQWQRDPSELHASVTSRIPTRTNTDDRYFNDSHQAMPADGYTAMFERMLDHPNIEVRLETDFFAIRDELSHRHVVYTGPVDLYFDRCYGELPYRSLEFTLYTEPTPGGTLLQPTGTINEPSEEVPYTRTTELRHLTGQTLEHSTFIVEHPRAQGDPYYPIPNDETRELYKRYEALSAEQADVTFVGRLARYQYLNMDQVTGQALATFEKLREQLGLSASAR